MKLNNFILFVQHLYIYSIQLNYQLNISINAKWDYLTFHQILLIISI